MNMSTQHHPTPCRFYAQGRCKFGDRCKFSHEASTDLADASQPSPSSSPSGPSHAHDASDARPRFKRGEIPCRAWKAGTCTKGSKCWFNHDISPNPTESHPHPHSSASPTTTIRRLVSGAFVTYAAGLDVAHLVTGFDTCTVRITNLAVSVTYEDVHALLSTHGTDPDRYHLSVKKKPDARLEAHVVTDTQTGRRLVSALDGLVFHEELLIVEVSTTDALEGMCASAGQPCEVLTISWRAPSVRYVAEYVDVPAAKAKVKELDRHMFRGNRLKVEMNAQPRGRFVPNLRLNAVKVYNLPTSVTDEDVLGITGAISVKRLPVPGVINRVEDIARFVRADIVRAVPGTLVKFDDPQSGCTPEGVVSARAHFSSWDDAHAAHVHLSDKRYGAQPVWLRLPDPMYFTLVLPAAQYAAQKAQWESLSGSIKDKRACTLNVREAGQVVVIRLSGSVKEATGALKVRVENLARGENVEGWHRSMGYAGNAFVNRVYSETGAYMRADWKRQSIKVYGAPRAVDRAREMIKGELDRLASLDYTVVLARQSVGFFVREGIQQLKETLGEDNVRFAMSTRKVTVSGGEEARDALDRLIAVSRQGGSSASGDQTCPICYDSASSPYQLACGHAYCMACLRHLMSSALESDQLPLMCLGDEAQCRVPIAISTIQQFLAPTSFNRLLEAAFEAYVAKHPDEIKHCKTPDCTQIYRVEKGNSAPRTRHCPSCFSGVCDGCHEEGHDGMSCEESKLRRDPGEQERLNDVWIASQGGRVKKCPQCRIVIEKVDGCNHMTCPCGAHICWWCAGVFTEGTIYGHMRREHGSIYGAVPDIGIAVNVEEQAAILRQVEMAREGRIGGERAAVMRQVELMREQAREEERRERGWGCTIM